VGRTRWRAGCPLAAVQRRPGATAGRGVGWFAVVPGIIRVLVRQREPAVGQNATLHNMVCGIGL